ncbi:MAG TPA: hypothetical protein VMD53_02430 [Rhizomicrobium sp.]|nr:hypothetical protein [Rhizomicrobium sp.]
MRMSHLKFAVSAGAVALLFAAPASASVTTYIRCDRFNVSCVHVHCNDQTGLCTRVNGYSDRYGAFMRAEYYGYYYSYGRWLCIRGDGCRISPEPPIDPTRPSP